jgi:hypothetical protein
MMPVFSSATQQQTIVFARIHIDKEGIPISLSNERLQEAQENQ